MKHMKNGNTLGTMALLWACIPGRSSPFAHVWRSQRARYTPVSKACHSTNTQSGQPRMGCAKYSLISLLNIDPNLLAPILALRLCRVVIFRVQGNQTVFMPNCSTRLNPLRLNNWIDNMKDSKNPLAVPSIAAENAFDSIHWPYLFQVLKCLF